MRTSPSLLSLMVVLCLSACSKKQDDAASKKAEPAPAAPAAPAPPATPYTGPLDKARLTAAKAAVKPFQSWDAGWNALIAQVGKPTKVDGNRHYWYLKDGDKCVELSVEKANAEVGAVGLAEYDKVMASQYAKCDAASAPATP
jgi:hypothetical protein